MMALDAQLADNGRMIDALTRTTHLLWWSSVVVGVVLVVAAVGCLWMLWTTRRWDREWRVREAVQEELWAQQDPDGYARRQRQRVEEEALVQLRLAQLRLAQLRLAQLRLAQTRPWWRRRPWGQQL